MGKEHETINEGLCEWAGKQKMFFVSTAPLSGDGRVNCSPKGMDTFRILGPKTVAYLDLTGSGVETIAHLQENGRITIMFCAFEGSPNIVRFYGKGKVLERGTPEYEAKLEHFDEQLGARAIIHVDVDRIIDSCGYSIPHYQFVGERDILTKWSERKGQEGVEAYNQENNLQSLDGQPGVEPKSPSSS